MFDRSRRLCPQAWRLVFWGDSITMRWRKDWHVDKWGVLPPPEGQGFETPYDVFMSAFGHWRPQSLGVGSAPPAWLRVREACWELNYHYVLIQCVAQEAQKGQFQPVCTRKCRKQLQVAW